MTENPGVAEHISANAVKTVGADATFANMNTATYIAG